MKNKHSLKAASKQMIEVIRQCIEREKNDLPPFGIYYSQSTKALVNRGLGYFRECCIKGKTYCGFFLTQAGFEYLDNNDQNKQDEACNLSF